jgi:hypothetical protein
MVGSLLDRAMKGPIDPGLTTNGEQTTDLTTISSSILHSAAPIATSAYQRQSGTASPTKPKRKFPIWVGLGGQLAFFWLFVSLQVNVFLGGDGMFCTAFNTAPCGSDFGIVVLVSTWPPLTSRHNASVMLGIDGGYAGHVGFRAGAFGEYDKPQGCCGPALFEFRIGTGLSLPGAELAVCQFFWS